MGSLGVPEMALILGVAVLLFGGKKLPELGTALGESIKAFKKGVSEHDKPAAPAPLRVVAPPPDNIPPSST